MTRAGHPAVARRVIILDRDGVVNHDREDYIKSPDEWTPIPGSLEALGDLTRAGYRVFIVSNQSGLGRGLFDRPALDAINAKMTRLAAAQGGRIAAVYFCPHAPEARCDCRKPLPGLFHRLAAETGIALAGVPAIGDSLRDLDAAAAVGARPILVRTGKGRAAEAQLRNSGTPVYDDLAAAVRALLADA